MRGKGWYDRKGVRYWKDIADAMVVMRTLQRSTYPEARVVEYNLGWAVQYYRGGPYYPEFHTLMHITHNEMIDIK